MPVIPLTKKDGTSAEGYAGETPLEELMVLLAKGKDVLVVVDDAVLKVSIKPFLFEQLPEIIEVTAPIFESLKVDLAKRKEDLTAMAKTKDFSKVISFIAAHKDDAYRIITAFEPDLTTDMLKKMTGDHIAELFITIIEVNLDFFIKRLTPTLLRSLSQLVQQVPKYGSLLPKN